MSTVSFQNLGSLSINQRVVHDDGGYKTANSGSLGSRFVNWIKETVFPSIAKAENIAAYEAARLDWARQNGTETEEVTAFFDEHIQRGDAFTPLALAGLKTIAGTEANRVIVNDIHDLVEPKGGYPLYRDSGLAQTFVADFPRATYILDGEPLSLRGARQDGSRIPSDHVEEWLPGLEEQLRDVLPHDLIAAVTNSAQQGIAVGVTGLFQGDQSPLIGPDGERIRLMAPPDSHHMIYNIIPEGGDKVRVAVKVVFEQTKLQPDFPAEYLAPGSRIDIFFDYVIEQNGMGGGRVAEIGDLRVNTHVTGVIRPGD